MDKTQPRVTVYSTSTCVYCKLAKDYFKSNDIDYKEVNVEEDQAAAMYIVDKTKQYGVPVIQIDDEYIVGFDKSKINKALAIA